jgi:hypothetical protein
MKSVEGRARNVQALKSAEESLKRICHIMEIEYCRPPRLPLIRSMRFLQSKDIQEMLVFLS